MTATHENFDELPLVCVGLPVFNSEKTISNAIETIINQTFENWELIISDNNSSDKTSSIIKEFVKIDHRIKFFQQEKNIGLGLNRYYVLKKARSKYFCWHAGDDRRSVDFLEENVIFLEKNLDYVASTSRKYFESHQSKQNPSNVSFGLDEVEVENRFISFFKNPWQSHSLYYSIMRTDTIKECTDLNENFLAQDWIIDLFLALNGKIALQKESYIELGTSGVSSTNPFKPFRNHAIEVLFPFFTFHKRLKKLINNFPFKFKLLITYEVYLLHIKLIQMRLIGYIKEKIRILNTF